MLFLSLLAAFATIIYIIFGVYILIRRPYAPMHRSFFYMCISFAIWTFGYFAVTFSKDNSNTDIYYKILYTGPITYCIFMLHFLIYLTDSFKNKILRLIIFAVSYIVPIIFLYQNWINNAVHLSFPKGFWYHGLHIFPSVYDASCLLMVILWTIRSKSKKNKKQGNTIVITAFITIPITHSADYYTRLHDMPGPAGIIILIWISAFFYLTVKYQMFEINPQYVLREITKNLGSIIILYNPYGYRTWSNIDDSRNKNLKIALQLYTRLDNIIGEKKLLMLYDEKNPNKKIDIKRSFVNGEAIIHCIVSLKYVTDTYGDFLGTMVVIAQYEREEPAFITERLSRREQQVAELLVSGLTYSQISRELHISQNTLKTHITNCYNKLGVNNKVEMINLIYNRPYNNYN